MRADEIKDSESLERWLKGRPVEDARVIAARAALRAMPMLSRVAIQFPNRSQAFDVVFTTMAATAAAWVNAAYPNRAVELLEATELFWECAEGTADAADVYELAQPAVYAASTFGEKTPSGIVAGASTAVEAASALAGQDIYYELIADARSLETGTTSQALAIEPLYQSINVDGYARQHWSTLRQILLSRVDENWNVWTDWFEARMLGEPAIEELEIDRLLALDEHQMEADARVANAKIYQITTRFPQLVRRGVTFISHSSQVDGARAESLAKQLEANGVQCWIAPRDIPAGADWNAAILSAIDACGAMLVLVSDASLQSPFVKAEVQHALEKRKAVLPVRLAAHVEPATFDLRLKVVQRVDLYASESEAIGRIVVAVRAG